MITDTKPAEDQVVIVYLKEGGYSIAKYSKDLTWSGYKMKFINLLSKGHMWFAEENVLGWNRIPTSNETI